MSAPIRIAKAADGRLAQQLEIRDHRLLSDVVATLGGDDLGPDPHDLLDSALAACTALTVTMVARRKQLPLDDIRVTITHEESGGVYKIDRRIELVGALSDEQKTYLMGIADKCPIHKALSGRFEIATSPVTGAVTGPAGG